MECPDPPGPPKFNVGKLVSALAKFIPLHTPSFSGETKLSNIELGGTGGARNGPGPSATLVLLAEFIPSTVGSKVPPIQELAPTPCLF